MTGKTCITRACHHCFLMPFFILLLFYSFLYFFVFLGRESGSFVCTPLPAITVLGQTQCFSLLLTYVCIIGCTHSRRVITSRMTSCALTQTASQAARVPSRLSGRRKMTRPGGTSSSMRLRTSSPALYACATCFHVISIPSLYHAYSRHFSTQPPGCERVFNSFKLWALMRRSSISKTACLLGLSWHLFNNGSTMIARLMNYCSVRTAVDSRKP